jgi:hypothetical protein
MKKILTALIAAAVVGGTLLSMPSGANARWGYGAGYRGVGYRGFGVGYRGYGYRGVGYRGFGYRGFGYSGYGYGGGYGYAGSYGYGGGYAYPGYGVVIPAPVSYSPVYYFYGHSGCGC